MNTIAVALFSHRAKAEPIQKCLLEAGIRAEIHDELRLEKLWFIAKVGSGSRLEVPVDQFERAEQLLVGWDAAKAALSDAIRCPECKSLRVDYPQFTRKSLLTNLAVGLAAEVGLVEKEFYCQDCHYTWPKEGSKPRRDRPNMAPHYFIEGVEKTDFNSTTAGNQRKAA
jgi:predicted Zn-ribbon and HTH transcriptional regulator